jgi:hypothetical protein
MKERKEERMKGRNSSATCTFIHSIMYAHYKNASPYQYSAASGFFVIITRVTPHVVTHLGLCTLLDEAEAKQPSTRLLNQHRHS